MNIEKLKSGSYRITQWDNGKRYRVTVDHKPTKTEAVRLLSEVVVRKPTAKSTLIDACNAYIDARDNIISPSTIVGYKGIVRRIPDKYGQMYLMQITYAVLQSMANECSTNVSTKTLRNIMGFIMSVLRFNGIEIQSPRLPQKEQKSPYIPTKEDVIAVFEEIKGTKYEVPIVLASLGLRRSEICALTIDDLDGNTLTINKAKVQNENNEWVVKSTKTLASIRTIVIPENIADKIREQGYVFEGDPGTIYKNLIRAQKKAGVPKFQLHKLRHFFASYMHDLGYSDKQIQEAGGWRDGSRIMKMVYQHAMDLDEAKQSMASEIGGLIKSPTKSPTENEKP